MRLRLALAAVPLLLVAGCTGEPVQPPPYTPPPTTAIPSPSPTGPVEPTMPTAATGTGVKAAEAVVRHYVALINYAQKTGDTKALRDIDTPLCKACEGTAAHIEKVHRRGGKFIGGQIDVTDIESEVISVGSQPYFAVVAGHDFAGEKVVGAGDLDHVSGKDSFTVRYTVVSTPDGLRINSWAIKP